MEENEEIKCLLKDAVSKMDEVLMWLRFGFQKNVSEALGGVFESDEQKVAFEHSDGERSSNEVAKIIGRKGRTVRYWWEDWERRGLMTGERKKKARFSLRDLGIEVPPPEKLKKKEEKAEEPTNLGPKST